MSDVNNQIQVHLIQDSDFEQNKEPDIITKNWHEFDSQDDDSDLDMEIGTNFVTLGKSNSVIVHSSSVERAPKPREEMKASKFQQKKQNSFHHRNVKKERKERKEKPKIDFDSNSNYRKFYQKSAKFHEKVIQQESSPYEFKIHYFRSDDQPPTQQDEEKLRNEIVNLNVMKIKLKCFQDKIRLEFTIEDKMKAIECCYRFFEFPYIEKGVNRLMLFYLIPEEKLVKYADQEAEQDKDKPKYSGFRNPRKDSANSRNNSKGKMSQDNKFIFFNKARPTFTNSRKNSEVNLIKDQDFDTKSENQNAQDNDFFKYEEEKVTTQVSQFKRTLNKNAVVQRQGSAIIMPNFKELETEQKQKKKRNKKKKKDKEEVKEEAKDHSVDQKILHDMDYEEEKGQAKKVYRVKQKD